MKDGKAKYWLDLYAASHRHPANVFLHEIGVPLIAFGLLSGLLPFSLPSLPHANLGAVLIAVYAAYYATLGAAYSLGILFEFLVIYAGAFWLSSHAGSGWIALGIFVLGWILQFIGHWIEGRPPAAMSSPRHALAFSLMAPLFTLDLLARRIRGARDAA